MLLAAPAMLRADGGGEQITPANWTAAWNWEPLIVASLFLSGALYARGLHWLRSATGEPRKLRFEAACFGIGWLLLGLALISPVHPLGRVLFSAHMTQHELLMVAAAPLLVLGRPGLVWLWALPRGVARRLAPAVRKNIHRYLPRALSAPVMAWILHAVALWVWHAPPLYESAVDHEALHALEHGCFFGTAVWFWHVVFFHPRRRESYGMAVLFLFTTALHTGALGALITFASRPWYPRYATATDWNLTPLDDQQLGGLIMWVPGGLTYMIAALALFASWLRDTDAEPADAPPTPETIEPVSKCASSPSP